MLFLSLIPSVAFLVFAAMKIYKHTFAKKSCLRYWVSKVNKKVLRRGKKGKKRRFDDNTNPPVDERFEEIEYDDIRKKALVPYRRARAPPPPRRELLALDDFS